MEPRIGCRLAIVLIGGMLVVLPNANAAGPTEGKAAAIKPARVEPINGSNVKKITLTEKAAQRLDISTSDVRQEGSGRRIVPYSAIIYDKDGSTWVYTSVEPLTFVRHKIVVDVIEGDNAFVKEGPAAGVKVAVTGVSQLYGVEKGVGH